MLKPTYPYYLANEPHAPNADLEVTDKFTGEEVARAAMASPAVIDQAIAAAVAAVEPMGMLAAYERQDILYQRNAPQAIRRLSLSGLDHVISLLRQFGMSAGALGDFWRATLSKERSCLV